ncbi:MAG: hypothetical protein C4315_05645 [Chloroflexota bacterium]
MSLRTRFGLETTVLALCLVLIFRGVDLASRPPDDWDSLEVAGIVDYLCRRPTGTIEVNYYPTGYPLLIYAQVRTDG